MALITPFDDFPIHQTAETLAVHLHLIAIITIDIGLMGLAKKKTFFLKSVLAFTLTDTLWMHISASQLQENNTLIMLLQE